MNRFSFRIPASTSNLGSGFDALSLALNRYLNVAIEESSDFAIEARGVTADLIPKDAQNLILRVANSVAGQRAWKLPAFRMTIDNEIPLARGLGSSAAAIIAGITCYELLTRDRLSDDEIFRYAFDFESHPDNLAAALYGGFVSAAMSATGEVLVARLAVAPGAACVAVIPEFELSTEKARAVLPRTYDRSDVVFNIQRAALTTAALTTGKWTLVRESMRDRIHQPYRAPMIPGLNEVLGLSVPGLFGIALSGAGPTVFAFTETGAEDSVGFEICRVFGEHGVRSAAHALLVDTTGRTIIDG
jgi:homoserine kinase